MTTLDPDFIDMQLGAALRERAADAGGEADFYRQIVRVAVATPQRHRLWVLGRRAMVVLAAALVGVGVVGASIGARLVTEREPGPPPAQGNGAILVLEGGQDQKDGDGGPEDAVREHFAQGNPVQRFPIDGEQAPKGVCGQGEEQAAAFGARGWRMGRRKGCAGLGRHGGDKIF